MNKSFNQLRRKTFAVIYRNPSTNFQALENALCYTLAKLKNQKLKYVVRGNIKYNLSSNYNNQKNRNYFNSRK